MRPVYSVQAIADDTAEMNRRLCNTLSGPRVPATLDRIAQGVNQALVDVAPAHLSRLEVNRWYVDAVTQRDSVKYCVEDQSDTAQARVRRSLDKIAIDMGFRLSNNNKNFCLALAALDHKLIVAANANRYRNPRNWWMDEEQAAPAELRWYLQFHSNWALLSSQHVRESAQEQDAGALLQDDGFRAFLQRSDSAAAYLQQISAQLQGGNAEVEHTMLSIAKYLHGASRRQHHEHSEALLYVESLEMAISLQRPGALEEFKECAHLRKGLVCHKFWSLVNEYFVASNRFFIDAGNESTHQHLDALVFAVVDQQISEYASAIKQSFRALDGLRSECFLSAEDLSLLCDFKEVVFVEPPPATKREKEVHCEIQLYLAVNQLLNIGNMSTLHFSVAKPLCGGCTAFFFSGDPGPASASQRPSVTAVCNDVFGNSAVSLPTKSRKTLLEKMYQRFK